MAACVSVLLAGAAYTSQPVKKAHKTVAMCRFAQLDAPGLTREVESSLGRTTGSSEHTLPRTCQRRRWVLQPSPFCAMLLRAFRQDSDRGLGGMKYAQPVRRSVVGFPEGFSRSPLASSYVCLGPLYFAPTAQILMNLWCVGARDNHNTSGVCCRMHVIDIAHALRGVCDHGLRQRCWFNRIACATCILSLR